MKCEDCRYYEPNKNVTGEGNCLFNPPYMFNGYRQFIKVFSYDRCGQFKLARAPHPEKVNPEGNNYCPYCKRTTRRLIDKFKLNNIDHELWECAVCYEVGDVHHKPPVKKVSRKKS